MIKQVVDIYKVDVSAKFVVFFLFSGFFLVRFVRFFVLSEPRVIQNLRYCEAFLGVDLNHVLDEILSFF